MGNTRKVGLSCMVSKNFLHVFACSLLDSSRLQLSLVLKIDSASGWTLAFIDSQHDMLPSLHKPSDRCLGITAPDIDLEA